MEDIQDLLNRTGQQNVAPQNTGNPIDPNAVANAQQQAQQMQVPANAQPFLFGHPQAPQNAQNMQFGSYANAPPPPPQVPQQVAQPVGPAPAAPQHIPASSSTQNPNAAVPPTIAAPKVGAQQMIPPTNPKARPVVPPQAQVAPVIPKAPTPAPNVPATAVAQGVPAQPPAQGAPIAGTPPAPAGQAAATPTQVKQTTVNGVPADTTRPDAVVLIDGIMTDIAGVHEDGDDVFKLAYDLAVGRSSLNCLSTLRNSAISQIEEALSRESAEVFAYRGNAPPLEIRRFIKTFLGNSATNIDNALRGVPDLDDVSEIEFVRFLSSLGNARVPGPISLCSAEVKDVVLVYKAMLRVSAALNAFGPKKLQGQAGRAPKSSAAYKGLQASWVRLLSSVLVVLKKWSNLEVNARGVLGFAPEATARVVGKLPSGIEMFDVKFREAFLLKQIDSLILSNASKSVEVKRQLVHMSQIIMKSQISNVERESFCTLPVSIGAEVRGHVDLFSGLEQTTLHEISRVKTIRDNSRSSILEAKVMAEALCESITAYTDNITQIEADIIADAETNRQDEVKKRVNPNAPTAQEVAAEFQVHSSSLVVRQNDLTRITSLVEIYLDKLPEVASKVTV